LIHFSGNLAWEGSNAKRRRWRGIRRYVVNALDMVDVPAVVIDVRNDEANIRPAPTYADQHGPKLALDGYGDLSAYPAVRT
jgi:hypothetical protein